MPMTDPKIAEQITAAIDRFLPHTPVGLKHNVRAVLQAALDRLDLVTREELEVQKAVLARTRSRLESLEQQVATLETKAPQK